MSLAPLDLTLQGRVDGMFRERDFRQRFEYSDRQPDAPWPEYDRMLFIEPDVIRWAKVLKTCAYVVVDEGPGGEPVVERWRISSHDIYSH